MKTITASLAILVASFALVGGVAVANRSLEGATLSNLEALDASDLEGTKAAMTWVNENALRFMPEAATLRAENVVAGIALAAHHSTPVSIARN